VTPEMVWALGRSLSHFTPAGIETPDYPVRSLLTTQALLQYKLNSTASC
jgi:hypothetical protein